MTTHATVSVLTPCYNHAPYLKDYFESLLDQTHPHVELVFIDDHSTDDSWQIARQWEATLRDKLERVELHRNPKNLGLTRTLERAAELSRGYFVSILESDDFLYPTKIERNVRFLTEQPDFVAVHSEVDFLHEPQVRLEKAHWTTAGKDIPTGDIFEALLWENHILTCTFCCRADAFAAATDFERYREASYQTIDYPIFLDLAHQGGIGYIDEPLACYRVVPNSISHPEDLEKVFDWRQAYYGTKLDYINRHGAEETTHDRAQRQLHQTLWEFGWLLRRPEDYSRGLSWLKSHRPSGFRSVGHHLRGLAIRSQWTWQLARKVEQMLGYGGQPCEA